jgi:hydroxymethylpyrimidine pyrophosphatase-like HAD family hydrolase
MNAYFFDVDGVLTNLQQETNKELTTKLSHILIDGDVLGLISGRSVTTQIRMVVESIEKYMASHSLENKHLIDNLFVSGEFGGASVMHKNGERIGRIDKKLALPQDLREKLTAAAEPYLDSLFIETDKQTMFSSPKKPVTDMEAFSAAKPELVAKYEKILLNYPEFKVLTDRYSINVKHKRATKRFATEQVLDWLKEKGGRPEQYFAFGDSISDLDIGEELYARDLPMEFIFVGKKHELKGITITFPISITNEDFDKGTLEFLNK